MSFLSHVTGAFAQPISENPTIVMMEAAFRHHDLDWRYVNFEVTPEGLADAVAGARAMGWDGFNCSLPHKVTVTRLVDEMGSSARAIGAVNCVVRRQDRLVGENTDGLGFLEAVEARRPVSGGILFLVGAGGAARAIAVEAARAGIRKIHLCNRSADRASELAALVTATADCAVEMVAWSDRIAVPRDVDLVVNATSVGLFPDVVRAVPVVLESVAADALVADVIANPAETVFLAAARSLGLETVGGREMLVNQAARSIAYWTGVEVDRGVMATALAAALADPRGACSGRQPVRPADRR